MSYNPYTYNPYTSYNPLLSAWLIREEKNQEELLYRGQASSAWEDFGMKRETGW